MKPEISAKSMNDLVAIQQGEITGYHVYMNLSKRIKNKDNQELLLIQVAKLSNFKAS